MHDFGSTPSLLKRPLRGTRRRVSGRRKALLACVAFAVIVMVLLITRSSDTALPPAPGHSRVPGSHDYRYSTAAPTRVPASTTEPHTSIATTHPGTAATAEAEPPTRTLTSLTVRRTPTTVRRDATGYGPDSPVPRDGFELPWVGPAPALPPSNGGVERAVFEALVNSHATGTAWREPETQSVVAYAKSGAVVFVTPKKLVRHRRGEHQKWASIYQSNETYQIPAWATPADRDTLQHASIFMSLASFRDHECATTVRDLYDMAAEPHRLYVGISEERKPSDASCIALIGAQDLSSGEARRVLYGPQAPASVELELRELTWEQVIAPRSIVSVDDVLDATPAAAEGATPASVFLHPAYAQERLACVAGELETLRDRLLLLEDDTRRTLNGGSVFRQGRGGPQQRPSHALAGCRVTTRVAPWNSARGPTFGRYITSLFFFDQDYYMVVDSHTRFSVHWDAKLITRVLQLPTAGVLSYYPNGYRDGYEREEYGKTDYMLMCTAQVLSNGMPKLGARWKPVAKQPVLQGFAAAGFIFGDAQYVLDTPFDPFLPYMFDGEEVLYSARMWTSGWDIYGPAESNIFHHYVRQKTPKFFSLIHAAEAARRVLSERRTLHMLRRAHPWVEELARRGYVTADGQTTLKPLPPYEAPETRLIVSDEVAAQTRGIAVYSAYYGMGKARTLEEYWQHTELTDDFVKKKDNEGRWMGGDGLCEGRYSG